MMEKMALRTSEPAVLFFRMLFLTAHNPWSANKLDTI
jgi:hypothetical protein